MSLPIGGFMPLPLPMMIPFMAAQSAAMAQAFGTYFQYGKRKISSMSNEEFNKLTPQIMHEGLTADIRAIIPSLSQSMHTYDSSMTPQIIKEFSEIAKSAISSATTEVVQTVGGGIELGVETSKTQINDFLAALTAWMAAAANTHYVNPNQTVQQTNVSVTDIELEQKTENIPSPSPPGTGPDLREQNNFRDKIANWNLNTLNAALSASPSPYAQWQINMLNKNKSKIVPGYQPTTTKENTIITSDENALIAWRKQKVVYQSVALSLITGAIKSSDQIIRQKAKSKQVNAVHDILKWISHARNSSNYLIKIEARQDYNNQIWKKYYYPGYLS